MTPEKATQLVMSLFLEGKQGISPEAVDEVARIASAVFALAAKHGYHLESYLTYGDYEKQQKREPVVFVPMGNKFPQSEN